MKTLRILVLSLLALATSWGAAAATYDEHTDWAFLSAYRDANRALGAPLAGETRVVFMGDSITEFWKTLEQAGPKGVRFINRGISGQTTPQMLLRFRSDVLDLQPALVVILAGTNDIAGNSGPATPEMIEANLASMCELAAAHHVRVVLSSVLPVRNYYWAPAIQPAPAIQALNDWMRAYADTHALGYLDYHASMTTAELGLDPRFSEDGVHPNAAGYQHMLDLMLPVVTRVLGKD